MPEPNYISKIQKLKKSKRKKKLGIPIRSNLPVVLLFALVFWATTALVYSNAPAFMQAGTLNLQGPVSAVTNNQGFLTGIIIFLIVSIIFLSIVAIKTQKRTKLLAGIMGVFLGVAIGLIAAANFQTNQQKCLSLSSNTYTFKVLEDQKSGMYNNSATAEIATQNVPNYKVKLQFSQETPEVHAGDTLAGHTTFSSANDTMAENYWQNGICANAKIDSPANARLQNTTNIQAQPNILDPIYAFRNRMIDTIRNADWPKSDSYSDAEALLSAIVCGQRMDLSQSDLYDSFKNAGLAHLVAVSGAHLSLVCMILLIGLKKLKVTKRTQVIIQSCFILCYLVCAAVPISALRAAFMAYIALFSFFSKRRPAPLNALGVCIIALIAINPQTAVSVSFALSAGSTLGIIMFARLFEYWILRPFPKVPAFIVSALCLTLAASICSQPLSISIFMQFPLIAPVANIICTPLFTLLCGAGLIASVLTTTFGQFIPFITDILMWFAYICSWTLVGVVRFLASVPYASIPASMNTYLAVALSVVLCAFLWFIWPLTTSCKKSMHINPNEQSVHNTTVEQSIHNTPDAHSAQNKPSQSNQPTESGPSLPFLPQTKRTRISLKIIIATLAAATAAAICILVIIPANSSTQLTMLDVGQGDSIVIESKGKTFMIDTGNKDNLLKQRLSEKHIAHLDGLLITHPDDDHCGSMDVIESLVDVDKFYCAQDMTSCNCKNCTKLMSNAKKVVNESNIVPLKPGNSITFGEVTLEVIWPDKYKDEGGNADSLCVLANVDVNLDNSVDATCLLCGDAEYEQIEQIQNQGRLHSVNVYKVGHHGSKNALSDTSVKALSPQISLVSVGATNKYGHPATATLSKLEAAGSKIYRTDKQGSVTCKFLDHNIEVSTAN